LLESVRATVTATVANQESAVSVPDPEVTNPKDGPTTGGDKSIEPVGSSTTANAKPDPNLELFFSAYMDSLGRIPEEESQVSVPDPQVPASSGDEDEDEEDDKMDVDEEWGVSANSTFSSSDQSEDMDVDQSPLLEVEDVEMIDMTTSNSSNWQPAENNSCLGILNPHWSYL
jgi:hypothetical protein